MAAVKKATTPAKRTAARRAPANKTPTAAAAAIPDLTALAPDEMATPPPAPAVAEPPAPAPAASGLEAQLAQLAGMVTGLVGAVQDQNRRIDSIQSGVPAAAAPPPVPAGIGDDVEVGAGELVRRVGFDHYSGAGGVDTEDFGLVIDVAPDEAGHRRARVAWLPVSDPVPFRDLELVE